MKLKSGDLEILRLLQANARVTAKEIAKTVNSPITTVFAKIKRMEHEGVIKRYVAILDSKQLEKSVTAFIFVSFSKSDKISQRELVKKIAKIPQVQEIHIVTGDWDIIIKVKEKDIDSVGKFVVDKLRELKGVEKTLTSIVLGTEKESTEIIL